MTISVGTRLGPYEILSHLGAGGMGEVYRARDTRLGREVAVKVLPEELSADRERLHRFEQQARAAGVLNHPNIVDDDDLDLRRLLRTLLSAADFGVLETANSHEAIQVFRAHANGIVAVLLDMRMAELGGEETFATLRPEVRVILSSGYEESETTSRFNTPGLAGFLQKPYIASELSARLLEALEGERKTA